MQEIIEAIRVETQKLAIVRAFEDRIAIKTAQNFGKLSRVVHDYFLGDTKNFDIFEFLKKGGTNNGR